jgi:hypothetical protein
MRRAMKVASVLLIASFALGSVWGGVASARSNTWVEVWCDSNVNNDDGADITLSIDADGQTVAGQDDRIGKILDASALEPGNKEAATAAYNTNAGFIQGWHCGALRYWDGTIVSAPAP